MQSIGSVSRSLIGQQRRFGDVRVTSVLPPTATGWRTSSEVGSGPESDIGKPPLCDGHHFKVLAARDRVDHGFRADEALREGFLP
jgi:hypothetical protein